MAVTPYPLVWDFYRSVDEAKGLGGVAHYFNEESQSLYLNNGLATKTALIEKGKWQDAKNEINPETKKEEFKLTEDAWKILSMDHVSNSYLYGVATDGEKLTFIRYIYGIDLSNIMNSWNWVSQIDNSITQLNSSVQNINPTIFGSESSLLQPGARITVFIRMGDSEPYPISVIWLDEAEYDDRSDTIGVSGRNTIGFYLKDQTFDGLYNAETDQIDTEKTEIKITVVKPSEKSATTTKLELTFREAMELILKKYAGLTKFVIQENENAKKNEFEFSPTDNLLSGIQKILDFYIETDEETNMEHMWEIAEAADGTIYIGRDDWMQSYFPKGHYVFSEGRDIFTRKSLKSSDGAFTRIRVTGKGSGGSDLKPVTVDVENFKYWALGKHKTKHIQAPEGKDQNGLKAWAEIQAKKYQNIGITEELTGPFRPQLLVGDVATVEHGDVGTILGVITEVRQVFGVKSGFKTEFSVDSGGYATNAESTVGPVYSRVAQIDGFNRKQRLVDAVRRATTK